MLYFANMKITGRFIRCCLLWESYCATSCIMRWHTISLMAIGLSIRRLDSWLILRHIRTSGQRKRQWLYTEGNSKKQKRIVDRVSKLTGRVIAEQGFGVLEQFLRNAPLCASGWCPLSDFQKLPSGTDAKEINDMVQVRELLATSTASRYVCK